MIAVVTAVLTMALKWLHGWQQRERLVAEGTARPLKKLDRPTAPQVTESGGWGLHRLVVSYGKQRNTQTGCMSSAGKQRMRRRSANFSSSA